MALDRLSCLLRLLAQGPSETLREVLAQEPPAYRFGQQACTQSDPTGWGPEIDEALMCRFDLWHRGEHWPWLCSQLLPGQLEPQPEPARAPQYHQSGEWSQGSGYTHCPVGRCLTTQGDALWRCLCEGPRTPRCPCSRISEGET